MNWGAAEGVTMKVVNPSRMSRLQKQVVSTQLAVEIGLEANEEVDLMENPPLILPARSPVGSTYSSMAGSSPTATRSRSVPTAYSQKIPPNLDTHMQTFMMTERSGYESPNKTPKKGWNDMTQVDVGKLFDGRKPRPYCLATGPSPRCAARSGARSVDRWQRDYNTKGLCEEKVVSLRNQRVVELKKDAIREAGRRNVDVDVVEEEMYQVYAAKKKRVDSGLRTEEVVAPIRTFAVSGAPPRLFDGTAKLEEDFDFKDAREMFRGLAWEEMGTALGNLDQNNKCPRALQEAKQASDKSRAARARGSFSVAFTPAELAKAVALAKKKAGEISKAANDLERLRQHLARKYGSVTAAWRLALDSDGSGSLSFTEWTRGLQIAGFSGSMKTTFRALDANDSGMVKFSEFMPQAAFRLTDFRQKLLQAYGTDLQQAWRKIDRDGNNNLSEKDFEALLQTIGYTASPPRNLFIELRFAPNRKYLNLKDFQEMPKVL